MHTDGKNMTSTSERMHSLDILRGADMACLVLIQPVLLAGLEAMQPTEGTLAHGVMGQLLHVPWQGFCFWDIIMPLFMFMSGITIPFSMDKYRDGRARVDRHFFFRLLKRFVVLWLLGMVVQGSLLSFDWHELKLYSNTLQSIAVGYVVVAVFYVLVSWHTLSLVAGGCFLAYIAVFALWGGMDFTVGTNICQQIDNAVLGHFRDGVEWHGDTWTFLPSYNYTWLLSSFNFIVTVWMGCWAGHILRSSISQFDRFLKLVFVGVILLAGAWVLSPVIPVIKHIWSSSMTLFSGGICMLLMAFFYFCIDIKGWTCGLEWLRFYGMNSLAAYVLGEYMNFDSLTHSLCYGLQPLMGSYYAAVLALGHGLFVLLILVVMYKLKIFVKA